MYSGINRVEIDNTGTNDDLYLIHGDCISELKNLEDKSVDLIVTDPPYNLSKDYEVTKDNMDFDEYLKWSTQWLVECKRVLKDDGTIYVFMGFKYISYIYAILEKDLGMQFNSWITWYYTQGIGKKKGFSPRHEDILMFTKTNNFNFYLDDVRVPQKSYRSVNNMRGANPSNVWEFSHVHYSQANRQNHPTQKPEGLFERMILASSKEGDVVLDPFLGSGTTLRVCQQLNRVGIGIEVNEPYVINTINRLNSDFKNFDSIDERLERVPKDLNDREVRMGYVKDHIGWFINHQPNSVDKFINNVIKTYGTKIDEVELRYLSSFLSK